MLLATLTGCSDDIYKSDPIADEGHQVTFIVDEFTYGDGTRASYTPRDDRYQFSWTEGDTLGVFGTETDFQVEFPIGNDANGNKVSFNGGNFGLRPEKTYVAYYPYAYENFKQVKFSGLNVATQKGNGSTDHLAKHDIMASVYTPVDQNGEANFEMKHLCSLIQFDLKALEPDTYTKLVIHCEGHPFPSNYTLNLKSDDEKKLVPTSGSTSADDYIVYFDGDIKTTEQFEVITVYAMMPADGYDVSKLSATLYNKEGKTFLYRNASLYEGENTISSGNNPVWEAGKAYRYSLNNKGFADDYGREYVDMGLEDEDGNPIPIYFGAWNIGATAPEEYGLYFAWGETIGFEKTNVDRLFSKEKYESSIPYKKYTTSVNGYDADLVPEDDAAHVYWGDNWRMPTAHEFEALVKACGNNYEFTTLNNVDVIKLTSTKTQKSIYFPIAGIRLDDQLYFEGTYSLYWSSSLSEHYIDHNVDEGIGYSLDKGNGHSARGAFQRYFGGNIRPVYSDSNKPLQQISLDRSSLTLNVGDEDQLTATVSPEDAFYRALDWSSTNENIVTVSHDGSIRAVGAGSATIIVKAKDGCGVNATCTVTIVDDRYIDLGLKDVNGKPIYWGRTNLGADITKPEDPGKYFAWGETTGFLSSESHTFDWNNYSLCLGSDKTLQKYNTNSYYGNVDNVRTLIPEDDAAYQSLGGNWRIPTKEEFDQLLEQCTWTWTAISGVLGYKVTGSNGNYIFLPAASSRLENALGNGNLGYYSSSSLLNDDFPTECNILYFTPSEKKTQGEDRYRGYTIRPVYHEYVRNTSITVAPTYKEMNVGESIQLTATVLPANALFRNVKWISENPTVAKVDENGRVTGLKDGVAIIKALASDDSGKFAICNVRVFQNHETVDLGLKAADGKPILWATCNIGADSPEDFGQYFAWGETTGYKQNEAHMFNWNNYTLGDRSVMDNKYVFNLYKYNVDIERGIVDNVTVLDPEDDAAFVLWGDNWRMPTDDEVGDLLYSNQGSFVNKEFEYKEDVQCINIKSANSQSLLLPIAGICQDKVICSGTECYYWSASLDITSEGPLSQNARAIHILQDPNNRYIYSVPRFNGCPIRPVYHEYQKITGITLNKSSVTLSNGSSVTLTASVNEDAYYKRVNWISNNENVVTVSKDGKITAVAPGTATIIAKAKDRSGKNATCTVTVTA